MTRVSTRRNFRDHEALYGWLRSEIEGGCSKRYTGYRHSGQVIWPQSIHRGNENVPCITPAHEIRFIDHGDTLDPAFHGCFWLFHTPSFAIRVTFMSLESTRADFLLEFSSTAASSCNSCFTMDSVYGYDGILDQITFPSRSDQIT